jgi:hypothetical protein
LLNIKEESEPPTRVGGCTHAWNHRIGDYIFKVCTVSSTARQFLNSIKTIKYRGYRFFHNISIDEIAHGMVEIFEATTLDRSVRKMYNFNKISCFHV